MCADWVGSNAVTKPARAVASSTNWRCLWRHSDARNITMDKRHDLSKPPQSAQPIYAVLAIIASSVATILFGVTSANAEVPSVYRVYSYEYIHYEILKFEKESWEDRFENFKEIVEQTRENSNHYSPSERIDFLVFLSDTRTIIAAQEYLLNEGTYLVSQWRSSKPKSKNKRLRSLESRVTRVGNREERFRNLQSLVDAVQDELDSQTPAREALVPTGSFSFESLGDQEKNLQLKYEQFNRDLTTVSKAKPYSVVSCFELIVKANRLLKDVKNLADMTFKVYIEFPREACNFSAQIRDSKIIDDICNQLQIKFNLYEKLNLSAMELLESSIENFEFILQKPRRSMVF